MSQHISLVTDLQKGMENLGKALKFAVPLLESFETERLDEEKKYKKKLEKAEERAAKRKRKKNGEPADPNKPENKRAPSLFNKFVAANLNAYKVSACP